MTEEIIFDLDDNLRFLFENIRMQVWFMTSPDTYGIVNHAHAEFMGLSCTEMEGRSFSELLMLDRESEARMNSTRRIFSENTTILSEEWLIDSSDQSRLLSITRIPVPDGDGNVRCVLCTAEDITERHRVVDDLRVSEERFRDLTELLPQTVFETDKDGCMVYANRKAFSTFGYPADFDISQLSLLDVIAPQQRELAAERVRQILTDQKSFTGGIEYTGLRKDCSTFPVIVYSSPVLRNDKTVGLRGIVVDISKLKEAQSNLSTARQLVEFIFNSAEDSIFVKDTSFRYVKVNPAMSRLLNIPEDKLIGMSAGELFGEDIGRNLEALDRRVLEGEIVEEFSEKPIHGEQHLFHTLKVPLVSEDGSITGICAIARDITESWEAERTAGSPYP